MTSNLTNADKGSLLKLELEMKNKCDQLVNETRNQISQLYDSDHYSLNIKEHFTALQDQVFKAIQET